VAIVFKHNTRTSYYFGSDVNSGYYGFVTSVTGIARSSLKLYVDSGNISTSGTITGNGSGLTNLNVNNASSGTLAIARGGTNSTATPTNGGIAYGNGSAYAFTAAGLSGQCLTSNGAGIPTWGPCGDPLPANNVTGSGTSGQVSFWNGTNTQTGDSGFVWDNTSKSLLLTADKNGLAAGVDNQHLVIRSTNNAIGQGPSIALTNSSNATMVGAKIAFERTAGNSQGDLVFYTKPDASS